MSTFSHPFVILCEGEGDKSLIEHLITLRNLGTFDVQIAKGLRFGEMLTAMPIGGNVVRSLIVTDSDDNPAASFEVIQKQISAAGLAPPAEPMVLSSSVPAVSVFLMPWHTEPGNIETLCLRAMRDDYKDVAACLDAYTACCPNVAQWRPGRKAQMQFRTLISSVCETDPNTPLRYAWSRTDFCIDLSHSCFDGLSDAIQTFGAA